MKNEFKEEMHEYCKDRARRKNRFANKERDKRKNNELSPSTISYGGKLKKDMKWN